MSLEHPPTPTLGGFVAWKTIKQDDDYILQERYDLTLWFYKHRILRRRDWFEMATAHSHDEIEQDWEALHQKETSTSLAHSEAKQKIDPKAPVFVSGTWMFSSVLLLFLFVVFFSFQGELTEWHNRLLGVFAALLSGLIAFFFLGDLTQWTSLPLFNSVRFRAGGGFGIFLFVLIWWWWT